MGSVLNRPTIFNVPEFAANLMLGESAVTLLEGTRLNPTRTLESGYVYKFPHLKEALADVMSKWK